MILIFLALALFAGWAAGIATGRLAEEWIFETADPGSFKVAICQRLLAAMVGSAVTYIVAMLLIKTTALHDAPSWSVVLIVIISGWRSWDNATYYED